MGPGAPRNAEASVRFEFEFDPRQLEGKGGDLPSKVNQHLRYLWGLHICQPATVANRPLFEDWADLCCGRTQQADDRNLYAVVSAVCESGPTRHHRTAQFWEGISGRRVGIYFQLHEEAEGKVLRNLQDRLLLLVWVGLVEFQMSKAPVLLFCRSTRQNAGPESELRGKSGGDITGFRWVLWDSQQHQKALAGGGIGFGQVTKVRTGRPFRYFDLTLDPGAATASGIDQTALPKYQHYLQVEQVLIPKWLEEVSEPDDAAAIRSAMSTGGPPPQDGPAANDRPTPRWEPGDVAFSRKKTVKKESLPGYRVDIHTQRAILRDLAEEFELGSDAKRAKALPFAGEISGREGRRMSAALIHEALHDEEAVANLRLVYERRARGAVVPELDPRKADSSGQTGARVQQLWAESLQSLMVRLSRGPRRKG